MTRSRPLFIILSDGRLRYAPDGWKNGTGCTRYSRIRVHTHRDHPREREILIYTRASFRACTRFLTRENDSRSVLSFSPKMRLTVVIDNN